ncbi:MAG TPA: DUF3887 domain-containing protein [Thermoanaerobaculia bacterium]|jgi:hypothetical protein
MKIVKRSLALLVLFAVGCSSAAPAARPAVEMTQTVPLTERARTIVTRITEGADVTGDFNDEMRAKLSADALRNVWSQLTTQTGELRLVGEPQQTSEAGYDVVYVPLTFANGSLRAKVVFDREGDVAGLFFTR